MGPVRACHVCVRVFGGLSLSEKRSHCIKCKAPITQKTGGRKRLYCGRACRGAAAYEIRRLGRHLERLEVSASQLRTTMDSRYRDMHGRTHKRQVAGIDAEIQRAETRLRALLAEGTDELTVEPERATRAVKRSTG